MFIPNFINSYTAAGAIPATVDEILLGERNDVFITPLGLMDAGLILPLSQPVNAVVIEFEDADGLPFTNISTTGAYLLNGILNSTIARDGVNSIIPTDAVNFAYDPEGVVTVVQISSASAGETPIRITRLPEGFEAFDMLIWPSLVEFDCELPSTLIILQFTSVGLVSLPALPEGMTTLIAYGCPNLVNPPALPSTLLNLTWSGSPTITEIPALPEGLTDANFGGAENLSSLPALPTSLFSLYIAGCNFSTATLDSIMVELGSCAPNGTADISGNPGSATCDTSPATANGWTVTT